MSGKSGAVCVAALLFAGACSEPPPSGATSSAVGSTQVASSAAPASSASAARVSEAQKDKVRAFFRDVGARAAAAVDASTKAGAKSRAGYAEATSLSTPAAFFLHADLFEKHGLSLDIFDAAMQDDVLADEAVRDGMAPLMQKLEALGAELPETDAADCERLTRRMVELAAEGPKTARLRAGLGPTFTECVKALPKHVAECIPDPTTKLDVATYDACVAKGAPKK